MQTRITSLVALLLAWGTILAPGARGQQPGTERAAGVVPIIRGQDYAPPDPVFPLPLFHDRPEDGGFYTAVEFLYFRQTNPLEDQVVAVRGLVDVDGSIQSALTGGLVPGTPGTFIGSGEAALSARDVGPGTWVPGYNIVAGWKFSGGVAVTVEYMHLEEAKYAATATIIPQNYAVGTQLENTFLTSFVFNFAPEFAGPGEDVFIDLPPVTGGTSDGLNDVSSGAAYGIWNAADVMQVFFTQRFDQADIVGRIPVYETDDCRVYGIVGSRAAWIWERFKWRTVDFDYLNAGGPADVAIYSNVVSNRMYGPQIGCGTEYRLGDTPAGTFAVTFDARAALMANFVKHYAKYELADRSISAKRSRRENTIVPELQGQVNLWWYPIEGIQLRVGYNAMAFFNTIASPNPVSINFGGLDPALEHQFRFYDGCNAGIAFIF